MRWIRAVAAVFVLVAALATPVGAQAASTGPHSHHASLAATSVNLFGAGNLGAGTHAVKPFFSTGRAASSASVAGAASVDLGAVRPALTQLGAFPMTSEDAAVAQFGSDQSLEPPDTMMAAGPTNLVETINSTGSIWTKSGTRTAIVDLNKKLPIPSGWAFSDPRILYDAPSGRWFFTGLGFNPLLLSSEVFVAVSKTSDPAGGFFLYILQKNSQLHDQPKIGVNDDKVVVGWNDFCCGPFALFLGGTTWVLQKSTMLSGSTTPAVGMGPNINISSPVPAQSMTSTATEYETYNSGTGDAVVLAINGTPAANNVTVTQTNVAMGATSAPPNAQQPGGSIATNDDRFLSATWRSNTLWVSGNNGCIPSGSATTRACLRMVDISTAGTPSLVQSLDVGKNGADVYFPAVTIDAAGNTFFAYSVSSASTFASAAAGEIQAGVVTGTQVYEAGQQTYGGTRWGDYSGISIDPTTGQVWAAAEYSALGSSHDWGTAAGNFSA